MSGLARICKMYGSIHIRGNEGNKVTWMWDYVNEKPRPKNEMTKEELAASEQAKWSKVKSLVDNNRADVQEAR